MRTHSIVLKRVDISSAYCEFDRSFQVKLLKNGQTPAQLGKCVRKIHNSIVQDVFCTE